MDTLNMVFETKKPFTGNPRRASSVVHIQNAERGFFNPILSILTKALTVAENPLKFSLCDLTLGGEVTSPNNPSHSLLFTLKKGA